MKRDWLTASSFELSHDMIDAINTLSIYAKASVAGVTDKLNEEIDTENARSQIRAFLTQFQALIQETEESGEGTVLGTNPRMGKLAQEFLAQKRSRTEDAVFSVPIEQLVELVQSEKETDLQKLIPYLRDLRGLIEQHFRDDISQILGES
jgi:hypothetical protein